MTSSPQDPQSGGVPLSKGQGPDQPPTGGDMGGYGTPPHQPSPEGTMGGYGTPPNPTGGYHPGTPPAYGTPPAGPYGAPGYGQGNQYGGYNPNVDPMAKSKLVAGLLGIFLGGFGVHRFYLGFNQIGVIQIVVTFVTCGLGSLWGFVEGILYLAGYGNFTKDASGRPLKD